MAPSILLVDNDPDSVSIYSLILRHSGFRVSVADNGQSAFELLAQSRPDLVVAGVYVGEAEGEPFVARVRSNSSSAGIPLILLDSVQRFDFLGLLAAGRTSILMKPCEPSRLVDEVHHMLGIAPLEAPVV